MLIPILTYLKNIIKKERYPLLLMLLTWAVFFIRTLSGRFFYFLDDLKIIYYPLEIAYAQFQHAWQLPLWSPLFGFGQPLLSWAQLGFFTPLHVLLRALYVHPLVLLQISIVAYFAIGMFGMYAFLRSRRLYQWPSALGAIIFTFSGFHVGHLNHVNFYTGTMILPWLLLATARFIEKPTARRAGLMSLAATVIALSSQPQITLYCFIIATIISLSLFVAQLKENDGTMEQWNNGKYFFKTIILTLLAGAISFSLSSLSILPLQEFLPLTDRSDAMMEAELLDFGYAPWHGITMILPYFYGDHSSYWGEKSFQELAAFIGIIPILLAGIGFSYWKKHRALLTASAILIIIGLIMGLGPYSPVYTWLVMEKILTSLSIPGRFIFFVVTGILLAASVGLNNLISKNLPGILRITIGTVTATFLIALPFLLRIPYDHRLGNQLIKTATSLNPYLLLVLFGMSTFVFFIFRSRTNQNNISPAILVGVTAFTLVAYGWSYNPLTPRRQAMSQASFSEQLGNYYENEGINPRLYSRHVLITSLDTERRRPTPPISPNFSVFQPITITEKTNPCFTFPFFVEPGSTGQIFVGLQTDLTSEPVATKIITAKDIKTEEHTVCFTNSIQPKTNNAILSFTSDHNSGINLYYYPSPNEQSAYFVRVEKPTAQQLSQSQKLARIVFSEEKRLDQDPEVAILARHLNVTANSSSARWIGALSLRNYREFIEMFFANDSELSFDGDGIHLLDKYRHLVDMVGITHMIQLLDNPDTDRMAESNYKLVSEYPLGSQTVRLYENPDAFPKAWLASGAIFKPAADEVRAALYNNEFNVKNTIALGGDAPPANLPKPDSEPATGTAKITRYKPSEVEVTVETAKTTWLVLSDSTTPQWHTYLDGQPAPYYTANSMFKAAHVPPGKHTVTFKYDSPAINLSIKLATAGVTALILLVAFPQVRKLIPRHKPRNT